MCVVILERNHTTKEIYELTDIFYINIFIKPFRKAGPLSVINAKPSATAPKTAVMHAPRCVKCSGNQLTKECRKSFEEPLTCCNYCAKYTANYRGCSYFSRNVTAKSTKPSQSK